MDRSRIAAITEQQLSLIATYQFLAAGGTEDALKWAVRDGWLEPYRRRVYAVVGAEASEFRPLLAAILAAGPPTAASHLAAAWALGAADIAPGAVEITSFDGHQRRLPGVRTHRSTLDPSGLIVVRNGVPTVGPALTVVQLALDRYHPSLIEKVANDFVKRQLTGFSAILKCLDAVGRNRALRSLCVRELEVGGHDDSPPARRLGLALKRAGLPPFVTQHKVPTDEGDCFLDFAWPAEMLGLEYNGWADHGTRSGIERDARRRARLAALGWLVLDATSGLSHADIVRWTRETLARRAIRRGHTG